MEKKKTEETQAEKANLDVPAEARVEAATPVSETVTRAVTQLSSQILEQSELAARQIENNQLERSLRILQDAADKFAVIARTSIAPAPTALNPHEVAKESDCGCGEASRHCCIQLYISGVVAYRGAGDFAIEALFHVKALDQAGLFPGLTSYVSLQPTGTWLPTYSPIGKFCVPCNGFIVVPLVVEAMDTAGSGIEGALEGKPETGSTGGSITLNCNCDTPSIRFEVTLGNTPAAALNPRKGKVGIEISARRMECGCC